MTDQWLPVYTCIIFQTGKLIEKKIVKYLIFFF